MKAILIDNGKSPDGPYNARLGFWLPTDSPYGNFQLKLMKLCEKLDEANRRLIESWHYWNLARRETMILGNAYGRHVYANEQAIYLIRRAADEMISLVWCLTQWEKNNAYPRQIKVDCIGALLKQPADQLPAPFKEEHTSLLRTLNEIANAFKHSFVHSDITLMGKNEPCVHALSLHQNKLSSGTKFHNVSMAALVMDFTRFYKAGMEWLRSFSERHR